MNNQVLVEDENKRCLAAEKNYEQYNLSISFKNDDEKPIKFLMLESEHLPKLFTTIKMILPHRKKFYVKFKFESDSGEKEIDETDDEDPDGFIGGILCEHVDYIKVKDENESNKIFYIELIADFFPMKIINLQIFATKITDENKFRVKSYCDNYVTCNDLKILYYKASYNNSYFTINKDPLDILIIFADENFIDDVVKFDLEKADKVMFWTDSAKAKDYMKKYPKKIMVFNPKFDFLLTPRFFKV